MQGLSSKSHLVNRKTSTRIRISRASSWLSIEQEAKLARRFFNVASDSSVPWASFPNPIKIENYANGFIVRDAAGHEVFRKIFQPTQENNNV